jgi:hypothetical protein
MNRAAWQQLAEERIRDAEALLNAQRWSGAYYLAGYAVECGLKSCILVRVAASPEILFEEQNKRFSTNCWTHDIEDLVRLADLEAVRALETTANPLLGWNWQVVKDWSEKSRYEIKSQVQAEDLVYAVPDRAIGVLPWIMARW